MQIWIALALLSAAACVHASVIFTNDINDDFGYDEEMWDQEIEEAARVSAPAPPGVEKIPCTSPGQWEGYASETIEYVTEEHHRRPHDEDKLDRRRPHPRPHPRPRPHAVTIVMRLHLDFTNQRAAIASQVFSREGNQNTTVLVDASKHAMYVIHPDSQHCQKLPFPGNLTGEWIPPNAKYLGSATFGLGDNSLNYDAFGVLTHQRDMFIGTLGVVTSDNCVPVSETGKGRSGGTFFRYNAGFFNLSSGIKDPKVFDVPSYCGEDMLDVADIPDHPVVHFAMRKFTN